MKAILPLIIAVCMVGCTDDESQRTSVAGTPLAVIDDVVIDAKSVEKQIDIRMALSEVNRQLNYPMRRLNVKKIRERQRAKYEKTAMREVVFKALILAAAKKAGLSAQPEDVTRIRNQYEMMLGQRSGSYLVVTSAVDQVGFLKEFEDFILDEARSLSYVRSLHPEVSLDVSEPEIDEYIVKLQEKAKRVSEHNAQAYQTATNVLERLKAGEDFGKLAKEFSCAEDKDEGGDMGDIILSGEAAYSNYAPSYLSALMMKDGAFSEVVTTPLGVEIFQVVASRTQEKPDDPIIKNMRHICFALRPAVGEYTRDSVRQRLLSDRLKVLYGNEMILEALSVVEVKIPGVSDIEGYFIKKDSKEDKE